MRQAHRGYSLLKILGYTFGIECLYAFVLLSVYILFTHLYKTLISYETYPNAVHVVRALLLILFICTILNRVMQSIDKIMGDSLIILSSPLILIPFLLFRFPESFSQLLRSITITLIGIAVYNTIQCFLKAGASKGSFPRVYFIVTITIPVIFFGWWHVVSTEPVGDEGHVLLLTYSITHDHDLVLTNNYRNRDSLNFMQNALFPQTFDPNVNGELHSRHSPLLATLLVPGFLIGNRMGASLTISILLIVLGYVLYLIANELSGKMYDSFISTFLMLLAPPLIQYSGLLFSEVPGALVIATGYYLTLKKEKSFNHILMLCGLSLLAFLIKPRFLLLLLPLCSITFLQLLFRARRWWWFVIVLGAIMLMAGAAFSFHDFLFAGHSLQDLQSIKWERLLLGSLGLMFDQQYGLFFYAPLYMLSLAGIWLHAWSQHRAGKSFLATVIVPLAAVLPYFFTIALLAELIGGYSPQPRFILCCLAVVGPYMVFTLRWLWTHRYQLIVGLLYSISLFWILIHFTHPAFLIPPPGGTNQVLKALSNESSIDFIQLFPLFDRPNSTDLIFLLGMGLIIIGIIYCIRSFTWMQRFLKDEPVVLKTVFALVVLSFLGYFIAGFFPATIMEFEDVLWTYTNGSMKWFNTSSRIWPYQVVMEILSGGSIQRTVRFEQQKILLDVWASNPQPSLQAPTITVLLDNKIVGECAVSTDRWIWYRFTFEATSGAHDLKFQVHGTTDSKIFLDKCKVITESGEEGLSVRFEPVASNRYEQIEPIIPITSVAGTAMRIEQIEIESIHLSHNEVSPGSSVTLQLAWKYREDTGDRPAYQSLRGVVVIRKGIEKIPLSAIEFNTQTPSLLEVPLFFDWQIACGSYFLGIEFELPPGQVAFTISQGTPFYYNMLFLDSLEVTCKLLSWRPPAGTIASEIPTFIPSSYSVFLGENRSIGITLNPDNATQALLLESAIYGTSTLFPFDAVIGQITITDQNAQAVTYPIRIGIETAEQEMDFPGVPERLSHTRPPVFRSWESHIWGKKYLAHSYYCILPLQQLSGPLQMKISYLADDGTWALYTFGYLDETAYNTLQRRTIK